MLKVDRPEKPLKDIPAISLLERHFFNCHLASRRTYCWARYHNYVFGDGVSVSVPPPVSEESVRMLPFTTAPLFSSTARKRNVSTCAFVFRVPAKVLKQMVVLNRLFRKHRIIIIIEETRGSRQSDANVLRNLRRHLAKPLTSEKRGFQHLHDPEKADSQVTSFFLDCCIWINSFQIETQNTPCAIDSGVPPEKGFTPISWLYLAEQDICSCTWACTFSSGSVSGVIIDISWSLKAQYRLETNAYLH